tara:strand:- start:308 stop:511 length:204 start_codon:yes stop_codon:yes gene_type:complete
MHRHWEKPYIGPLLSYSKHLLRQIQPSRSLLFSFIITPLEFGLGDFPPLEGILGLFLSEAVVEVVAS